MSHLNPVPTLLATFVDLTKGYGAFRNELAGRFYVINSRFDQEIYKNFKAYGFELMNRGWYWCNVWNRRRCYVKIFN